MSGLFALHLEDASGEGTRLTDAKVGGLDESETATAEIAELRQEEAEIVEADAEAEDMGERVDLAEELTETVEPVVTEGAGLDVASMKLLLTGMRRVAGPHGKHLVGRDVKMESINAGVSGRREQTRIQFESLKDTLKSAWEAIKAAFKKAWAKVKTWYIKTFDASKKLKARAEKIRSRAENSSATIDKKNFSFSGAKSIAVDGKVKDGAAFVTALGQVESLASKILDTVKTDQVGNVAEKLADAIGEVDEARLGTVFSTIQTEIKDKAGIAGLTGTVSDAKVKASFGETSEVDLAASGELPGGKIIVNIIGKVGSERNSSTLLASLRRTRTVFTNAKDKPKEVAGEVVTLTTSQIGKVCDTVVDIAEKIFDFKKGWENRDKDQEKTIKTIDDAFREVSKDNDENSSTSQRYARGLASAATGLLRRDASFKASFVGYAMATSNVALSYCERSLAQHKK